VIVVDVNLLLYAYHSESEWHEKARVWLEEALSSDAPVGLPWQSISAFVRISTNPKISGVRFTTAEAVEVVEEWLNRTNVRLIGPGDQHWSWFRSALVEGQARGALVPDAELAALTIEHGGTLHTTDRGFGRFPGLRWKNPLIEMKGGR
jgi:uncharacterized protein